MQGRMPTRQEILADFRYCTEELGGDSRFQFERAARRWLACGYPEGELALMFEAA